MLGPTSAVPLAYITYHLFWPTDADEVPAESILHSRAKTLAGIPNLLELDWISWLPNGAHCFFSPISPVTGADSVKQFDFVKKRCAA